MSKLGLAKKALPLSRVGLAMWAWRHRAEIGGWAGYVARSAPRVVAGDTADVKVEGRLRARLTADSRTRNVDGLRVAFNDGIATLSGTVPSAVKEAALTIAENTAGVREVRDQMRAPGRRFVDR